MRVIDFFGKVHECREADDPRAAVFLADAAALLHLFEEDDVSPENRSGTAGLLPDREHIDNGTAFD